MTDLLTALATFLKWGATHKVTEPSQLDQRVLDRYNAYLLEEHYIPNAERVLQAILATTRD